MNKLKELEKKYDELMCNINGLSGKAEALKQAIDNLKNDEKVVDSPEDLIVNRDIGYMIEDVIKFITN